jgi:hypothetical protein
MPMLLERVEQRVFDPSCSVENRYRFQLHNSKRELLGNGLQAGALGADARRNPSITSASSPEF